MHCVLGSTSDGAQGTFDNGTGTVRVAGMVSHSQHWVDVRVVSPLGNSASRRVSWTVDLEVPVIGIASRPLQLSSVRAPRWVMEFVALVGSDGMPVCSVRFYVSDSARAIDVHDGPLHRCQRATGWVWTAPSPTAPTCTTWYADCDHCDLACPLVWHDLMLRYSDTIENSGALLSTLFCRACSVLEAPQADVANNRVLTVALGLTLAQTG